jgi:hypothetical protein
MTDGTYPNPGRYVCVAQGIVNKAITMLRVMIMSYDAQRALAANDQLAVCSAALSATAAWLQYGNRPRYGKDPRMNE